MMFDLQQRLPGTARVCVSYHDSKTFRDTLTSGEMMGEPDPNVVRAHVDERLIERERWEALGQLEDWPERGVAPPVSGFSSSAASANSRVGKSTSAAGM